MTDEQVIHRMVSLYKGNWIDIIHRCLTSFFQRDRVWQLFHGCPSRIFVQKAFGKSLKSVGWEMLTRDQPSNIWTNFWAKKEDKLKIKRFRAVSKYKNHNMYLNKFKNGILSVINQPSRPIWASRTTKGQTSCSNIWWKWVIFPLVSSIGKQFIRPNFTKMPKN